MKKNAQLLLTTIIIFMLSSASKSSFAQQGGYALQFDGSDDYVTITDGVVLGTTFTQEMWIFPTDASASFHGILGKLPAGGNNYRPPMIYQHGRNIHFGFCSASNINYLGDAVDVLTINSWNHLALTFDGTTYLVYVNGKQVYSSLCASGITPIAYGQDELGRIGSEFPFLGKIDEVRIWNTTRTEAEIKANMYKEIGTDANLKAYYKMSDGTGISLTDNSGNSRSGTLTNGPAWKASAAFTGSRQGLDFDGSSHYVLLPETFVNNTMSVELWANATDWTVVSGYQTIIGCTQSGGWAIYLENSKIVADVGLTSGGYARVSYNATNLSGWNHLAFTADNVSLNLYIDGVLKETKATGGPFSLPHVSVTKSIIGTEMGLSNAPDAYYFQGKIDEVRIWNDVRTEPEINENMTKTMVGSETGLAAYYRMDYVDGLTLYDNGPNAKNGTLYNMDATDWIASPAFNTWIGGESSDWGNASNWSNGIPTSDHSVGLYKWTLPDVTTYEAIVNSSPLINNMMVSSDALSTFSSQFNASGTVLLRSNTTLYGSSTTSTAGNLMIGSGKSLTIPTTGVLAVSDTLTIRSHANNSNGSLMILGGFTGAALVERYVNPSKWHIISAPVKQVISIFIGKNLDIPIIGSHSPVTYGMSAFVTDAGSGSWLNFTDPLESGNLGVGQGYMIRTIEEGTIPTILKFRGKPNSGIIYSPVSNGWNCIGNPYTTAIKINRAASTESGGYNFITINNNAFADGYDAIYVWDAALSPPDYVAINHATVAPNYAQVGQGFFVKTFPVNSFITFNSDIQVHQGTALFKASQAPYPEIKLTAKTGNSFASTLIKFIEGTHEGLDKGYDAGIFKANPAFSLYTKLVEDNGIEFQLQCLPPTGYEKMVIPIGIDSKSAGEIVFTVETVQLDPACKVILQDKLTNTFTDLSKSSYKVAIAANTAGTGRFYLHTGDIISGLEDQVLQGKLTAYANGNQEIRVLGEVGEGAVATLVNGLGQVVLTKKLGAGSLNIIGLPNFNSGIYLLNINDKGTTQTIKIMIRK